MKEKLKYNFLHILLLHYPKFYDSFSLCCTQGRHFFVIRVFKRGSRKLFCLGDKIKKTLFFETKAFTELPFRMATVFSKI